MYSQTDGEEKRSAEYRAEKGTSIGFLSRQVCRELEIEGADKVYLEFTRKLELQIGKRFL